MILSTPPSLYIHSFLYFPISFSLLTRSHVSTIMLSSSNLSSPPPRAFLFSSASATYRSFPRVSFHPHSPNFSSRFFSSVSSSLPSSWISSARSAGGARRSACPCVLYSFIVKGMAELVQDKDPAVVASGSGDNPEKSKKEVNHSRTFIDARSEEGLF